MRTRSLATLLLLLVTAWTAAPAWALVRCDAAAATPASKPHCKRPCAHCKTSPQRVTSASLEKGCCAFRAPAPSQAAEPQKRGGHEVQGPQLVLLPPPAAAVLAAPGWLAAPPAPPRLALARSLPRYRPLLR